MSLFSAANLIRVAAALLILNAVLHTMAWGRTRALSGERRAMAALLWFLAILIGWLLALAERAKAEEIAIRNC